jgi:general L-amino acid transport system substrate-binding protein
MLLRTGFRCECLERELTGAARSPRPAGKSAPDEGVDAMKTFLLTAAAAAFGLTAATAAAATLDDVKAKGHVQCGVSEGLPGFSNPDAQGNWLGLDVEFCRAVAAAIFGDPEAVQFTPLSAKDRFTALQSGEVDILSRNTTWTMTRDASLGLHFAGVTYYDGQGFMIRRDLEVDSALELSGASVCTQTGTTTELNLADFFRANNLEYETVAFEGAAETLGAYSAGRCDVFTTDASGLYAYRLNLPDPDEHMVLPEIISKEPLGPVVRQGDDQWFNLVKWVLNALVNAEELGVDSGNVDQMMGSDNPEIRRLLGQEGSFGEYVGLDNEWAVNVIRTVGNYGEIFERNVGQGSELKIDRGINQLWTKGGIMYAPPIR